MSAELRITHRPRRVTSRQQRLPPGPARRRLSSSLVEFQSLNRSRPAIRRRARR